MVSFRFFRFLPLAAAVLLTGLAACGEDSTGPGNPGGQDTLPPAPWILRIAGDSALEAGGETRLAATVFDAAGDTVPGIAVAWSSSDSARVSVNGEGAVKANRIATVSLVATAETPRGVLRDTFGIASSLPGFAFVFDDTVPATERHLILDGIQDARNFQRLAFDKRLEDSLTISGVYAAAGCAGGGAAAFAGQRTITFCLGNQGWKAHGPGIRQKIVQHELFHLWQFAYWSADPAKSPTWLVEGAAEVVGYYGIMHRGWTTFETALGCQRKESFDFAQSRPPGLPPLQDVESRQAFQSTQGPLYTHSMLGVHYLLESGDGLAALELYGDLVKTSATWQEAFQQAFKMTPATFYSEFPAYVSGLEVPAMYACRI